MTLANSNLYRMVLLPTMKKILQGFFHNKKILVIGSESGQLGYDILHNGAREVIAVEGNDDLVQAAIKTYGKCQDIMFKNVDVTELKMDRDCDVAVSVYATNFIENEQQLVLAFKNIHKALKDEGVFAGIVPNIGQRQDPSIDSYFGVGLEAPSSPWKEGNSCSMLLYSKDKTPSCSRTAYSYSKGMYEDKLKEAGFQRVFWLAPCVNEEVRNIYYKNELTRDVSFLAFKQWKC